MVPPQAPLDGPDETAPDPVMIDPGLFAWFAPGAAGDAGARSRVRGFRHGVRGRLTRDLAPLLFADAAHLAPDRPPRSGSVEFDGIWLHLARPEAAPPRVTITEARYGDFDLTAEASMTGVLPEVEIGDVTVGPAPCTWTTGVGSAFSIRRRGTSLEIAVDGKTRPACSGPSGRVSIALRAPLFGEALVRKLSITRQ